MPKFKFDEKEDKVRGDGGRRKTPRHDPMARPTLERQVSMMCAPVSLYPCFVRPVRTMAFAFRTGSRD